MRVNTGEDAHFQVARIRSSPKSPPSRITGTVLADTAGDNIIAGVGVDQRNGDILRRPLVRNALVTSKAG